MAKLTVLVVYLTQLFATFFVSATEISYSSENSLKVERCSRARKLLQENITKFHNRDSIFSFKSSSGYSILSAISKLLDDSYVEIASKTVNKESIRHRLWSFSPYLLFKDDEFNTIVHEILVENYPETFSLNDPRTPDKTVLMVLKYAFHEEKKIELLPRYIYLGIISFFFEMVFGKDIPVPVHSDTQIVHFLAEMVQKYDLPESLKYFYRVLRSPRKRGQFFDQANLNAKAINLLSFLSKKPSVPKQLEFYRSTLKHDNVFDHNLQNLLLSNLSSSDKSKSILADLVNIGPTISTSSFSRIRPGHDEFLKTLIDNHWFSPNLYKSFGIESNSPVINYVWSRDYNHPFSIKAFKAKIGEEVPDFFVQTNIPYILKLNMMGKVFKEYYGQIPLTKCSMYDPELFEMLVEEDLLPPIKASDYTIFRNVNEFTLNSRFMEAFIRIFQRLFNPDAPLLPLLFLGKKVKYFKDQIRGKFDLNVIYSFNQNQANPKLFTIQYSSENESRNPLFLNSDYCMNGPDKLIDVHELLGGPLNFLDILERINDPQIFDVYGITKVQEEESVTLHEELGSFNLPSPFRNIKGFMIFMILIVLIFQL